MPSSSIVTANDAVKNFNLIEKTGEGPFVYFTAEENGKIGKWGAEFGVAATV